MPLFWPPTRPAYSDPEIWSFAWNGSVTTGLQNLGVLKRAGEWFSEQEDNFICAMLEKRVATVDALVATSEPADVQGLVRPMPRDLSEISSVDLMHCALRVKT
jgi:hypothetical protein